MLLAATAASGGAVRDISLYDALHMHDIKPLPLPMSSLPTSSTDRLSQSQRSSISDSTYPIQQINEYHSSSSSGTCVNYSPLGPRCYSPSESYEMNKYQRVEIKAEGDQQVQQAKLVQQHHLSIQQQQQLQLLQLQQQRSQLQQQQQHHQQQQQQLAQQYQQFQQYQIQQERQQLLLLQQQQAQQLQCQSLAPAPIACAIPRSSINTSSHPQISNFDYRQDNIGSASRDSDLAISPGLFDRIAFGSSPRVLPIAQTSSMQKYNERIVVTQPLNQMPAADARPTTNANQHHDTNVYNTNVTNINNVNIHINCMSNSNSTNGNADFNNNSTNSTYNHNRSARSSISGGFIDFDESIFEDWMSDETEMDFIEGSEEPTYKSPYDFLSNGCDNLPGCGPAANFCLGNTLQNATYPSSPDRSSYPRNATYVQNTNSNFCGFSTGHSNDGMESRRTMQVGQNVQGQGQVGNNQLVKNNGFSGAVRSLGGRFCGPSHIDTSYQPLENFNYPIHNDSKVFPGGHSQQIQDRNFLPITQIGSNHYDQNGIYRGSSDTIGTVASRSTFGGSLSQNYNNVEGQARTAFNSYFTSATAVPTGQSNTASNSSTGSGSTVPYMNPTPNPIYRFVSATHPNNNNNNIVN